MSFILGREKDITELLRRLEQERGIKILYAVESGSRAWGFASEDSDFDIRFLYVRRAADYWSAELGSSTIEIPIFDDLDPGGWDLRKALGLLKKSNGPLLEWLHSPIVSTAIWMPTSGIAKITSHTGSG